MKLPSFKRLFTQDYKDDYKDLVSQLASVINIGFESLYDAVNNKLSLKDNIACTVGDINVQVTSDGTPIQTATITLKSNTGVLGLTVLNIKNTDSPSTNNLPININYTVVNNKLTVSNIQGLKSGVNYTIKVVAWAV